MAIFRIHYDLCSRFPILRTAWSEGNHSTSPAGANKRTLEGLLAADVRFVAPLFSGHTFGTATIIGAALAGPGGGMRTSNIEPEPEAIFPRRRCLGSGAERGWHRACRELTDGQQRMTTLQILGVARRIFLDRCLDHPPRLCSDGGHRLRSKQ